MNEKKMISRLYTTCANFASRRAQLALNSFKRQMSDGNMMVLIFVKKKQESPEKQAYSPVNAANIILF
jgi:hypothetical protein